MEYNNLLVLPNKEIHECWHSMKIEETTVFLKCRKFEKVTNKSWNWLVISDRDFVDYDHPWRYWLPGGLLQFLRVAVLWGDSLLFNHLPLHKKGRGKTN